MNSAEVLIKFKGDNKDLNKNIDEAEKKTSKLSSSISGGFKAATVGIVATATAIGKIAIESTKAYAEYEQLLGGVSTLFGTRDAKTVEEYAQLVGKSVDSVRKEFDKLNTAQEIVTVNAAQAYKTAGMSANDYMTTISGFAASLKQSIKDPEKLANAANQAVIDMSDNANKMGTSMEAIQNAYQGFAKQNYTMLDNLKLGYGGTKTEMERLLKDASKISGIKYNIDNLGDVYQAIHVIQTQIGITGTTAKEASSTISGSLNMTKAAYKNLLVALADGEGVDEAFNDLLESATTFAGNVIPIAEKAIDSIVEYLPKLADIIIKNLPEVLRKIIPKAIEVSKSIIMSVIDTLPELIPVIIEGIIQLVSAIAQSMPEIIDKLLGTAVGPILAFIAAFKTITTVVSTINNLKKAFVALNAIMAANPITIIVALLAALVAAFIYCWKNCEAFRNFWIGLWENIKQVVAMWVDGFKIMINGIVSFFGGIINWFKGMFNNWINGWRLILNFIAGVPGAIINFFASLPGRMLNVGLDIVKGIGKGITNGVGWLKNRIKEFVGDVTSFIKKVFKIGSPSKLMAQQVGQWLPKGIGVGITANTDSVYDAMDEMQEGIMSTYGLSPQMTNSMGMHYSPNVNVYNNVDVSTDPLGQTVSQIKTFSGGAKNDYNYGMGA